MASLTYTKSHSGSKGWQVNFSNSHAVAGKYVSLQYLMPLCGTLRMPLYVISATLWAHTQSPKATIATDSISGYL